MFVDSGRIFFSASDLNAWLGCRHATFMDLKVLNGAVKAEEVGDVQLALIQKKGIEHEERYLAHLRDSGRDIVAIDKRGTLDERVAQTHEAMKGGVEVVYQAAFLDTPWNGAADFLLRVDGKSRYGNYSYEPLDTKLARSAQPKHVIQLCVYSRMLSAAQVCTPQNIHLVLGDMSQVMLPLAHFVHYAELAQRRLESFAAHPPEHSVGERCAWCGLCRWQAHCEEEWERIDHLNGVANITRVQIATLRANGVYTLRALGDLPDRSSIPQIQAGTLSRLRQQARLQNHKRDTGRNVHELLPHVDGKGFARLPRPDPGDLFFDMEGDPLIEGGLEYLFGFAFRKGDEIAFQPFWGHSRDEEKRAFEQAMDFIGARLEAYPDAHIYHYASYEQTAFNALSTRHGTREAALDDLLRGHKFVDLYRVVREAIRVSEPSYSIKNLETFYMPKREGEVASGGDSIVMYERWRELGDAALLQEIEDYNATDCRSTLLLRDWLLTLKPANTRWFAPEPETDGAEKAEVRNEAQARLETMTARLCDGAPEQEKPFHQLASQLLEFHRREAKAQWWKIFNWREMSGDALEDEVECLGNVRPDRGRRPESDKRSLIHYFRFDPQQCKLREGNSPQFAHMRKAAGAIWEIDAGAGTIALRIGNSAEPYPKTFSLIPDDPIGTKPLREAIYRYAEAIAKGGKEYKAITRLLKKELPVVTGVKLGEPIVEGESTVDKSVAAICALKNSTLVVQGPPGAGKTYTASHAIVELLKRGKRVGVSSNSHKAIVTLLKAVEEVAIARKIKFRGAKKCSGDDDGVGGKIIEDVKDNKRVCEGDYQLIAGTAWLFARDELDQALDYLFIDEAGQVALANVIATGTSARNIVLIGDQMQLAQPSQGVHPGDSGLSALEYALGAHATVPPQLGIFLDRTRRMHPDVCRFISEAFYDGRLNPAPGNERQRLVLGRDADASLAPTGLRFIEVEQNDCSQKNEAEAKRLAAAFRSLLQQSWIDRDGKKARMGLADILVVSPYNMQVEELRLTLPEGARVGTVDKFQGQEAPAVLVSMATSSADSMPRGIEFLFSRNRLNVAISRAHCLAVIFANPRLLEAACTTVEQLRLVDALCWAKLYAEA
ncbi:MAG TPA: TM0106 family RecB-like putative nuclease [Rhizomicrobium sp.]